MKALKTSFILFFLSRSLLFAASLDVNQLYQIKQLTNLAYSHQEILNSKLIKSKSKKFQLNRFDLKAGLTAQGDVGVLTFSGGSALEFIWRRNLDTTSTNPQVSTRDIKINPGQDPKKLQQALFSQIKSFLSVKKFRRKFCRKLKRVLYRDAARISRLTESIVHMPRIGNWYIDRFFKSYSFSKSLSLGVIKFGGSHRLRFRFKLIGIPYKQQENEKLNPMQKNLQKTMNMLGRVSHDNSTFPQFKLFRARVVHDVSSNFDIAVASLSIAHALTLEYKNIFSPMNDYDDNSSEEYNRNPSLNLNLNLIKNINQVIIRQLGGINHKKNATFSLNQIRVQYSYEKEIGIKLATVSKGSSLSFHYGRIP